MRIALINENSQGAKNGMIYNSLKKVADQYGFEVDNYGMYTAEDEAQLTYVQAGILAAAIQNNYTSGRAAVMALEAGADLLLMPADFKEAYTGVLDAVKTGELTEQRLDQSLERILRVKLELSR